LQWHGGEVVSALVKCAMNRRHHCIAAFGITKVQFASKLKHYAETGFIGRYYRLKCIGSLQFFKFVISDSEQHAKAFYSFSFNWILYIMSQKITKAVFPVAGLGTRSLPATKAVAKEMLPVVDKPLIQYAVEEAVAAGIDTMVFVTGRNKNSIPDHFDKSYELEKELEKSGKTELLNMLRNLLPSHVSCVFVRQAEALGLGHAVHCAKPVVGNEPFAVILPDDLIEDGSRGCMKQMVDLYNQHQCSVLGVEPVDPKETHKYGIVEHDLIAQGVGKLKSIVEKPRPEVAPSNIAVVGRYILSGRIFEKIEQTGRGTGGEIQLTDAIAALMKEESVLSYQFEGHRYDCGSKFGFLLANVEYGLLHPEIRGEFAQYLQQRVRSI
jgi:UTP--glucose-1-phosphate uridylyltransferase